ncbi:MAG: phosphoenolpyruvate hydrolase family protein [Lachnospiraceae bacterium]|nr:phosphoenolpyruvate hydrolase family protein [Lachnospiraceae bacterium]
MSKVTREEIIKDLREKIERKEPIVVAGAGYGLMGMAEDDGGADLIMAYNTGIHRMNGLHSVSGFRAICDANEEDIDMGKSLIPVVHHTPVIVGIGAGDPYRSQDELIDTMMEKGFDGITAFPKGTGLDDPTCIFASTVRKFGLGDAAEARLIRKCRDRNIFTVQYAHEDESLKLFVDAGVDCICAHMGGTAGGTTGQGKSVDEVCEQTQRFYEKAYALNPDLIILTHGGPLGNVRNVGEVLTRTSIHGFIGASTIERIPTENAVISTIKQYHGLRLR